MPVQEPIQSIFFRNWEASHIPEILEEIYLREVYKPYLLGRHDLTIVDIGANIGLTSYYFKDYAKQVFAIEPDRNHIEELSKMLEFNKITNVKVCPYAISNITKKGKLFRNGNSTAHNLINGDPNNVEEIDTLSFDDFIKRQNIDHIDLLKLDPEGEEGKIITSDGFAKFASKINVVVGEWHTWGTMEHNQFSNTFTDLGFKFNWIPNMKASVYTAVRI